MKIVAKCYDEAGVPFDEEFELSGDGYLEGIKIKNKKEEVIFGQHFNLLIKLDDKENDK